MSSSPTRLSDAIERLRAEPDLVPIAGCTDLMVSGALDRLAMDRVLDLTRIEELQEVSESEGQIIIGAGTTFSSIRADRRIRSLFPSLAAAASEVGGWQIQNRATLGGNMANASPAGDSLPVLLALNARVDLVGPAGERTVPYDDFHLGYRETALQEGEIIARVRLPIPRPGSGQGFRKVGTRRAQAISKIVVAVKATVKQGRFTAVRLAAGSVAATPIRLFAAEQVLVGSAADSNSAAAAGRAAENEVEPIDDVRSTARYRSRTLARVVRRLMLDFASDLSSDLAPDLSPE